MSFIINRPRVYAIIYSVTVDKKNRKVWAWTSETKAETTQMEFREHFLNETSVDLLDTHLLHEGYFGSYDDIEQACESHQQTLR